VRITGGASNSRPLARPPARLHARRRRNTVQRMSRSSWSVAAGVFAVYLLSTLPTPLYPLYQEAFGFSPLVVTLIYSAYVIGAIATMFFLGRLADQIGRRPVTVAALCLAIAACAFFLIARSTAWLFPARILSGFAVALASGATASWLVDLTPHRDGQRATRIVVIANLAGLGLGPFYAGLIGSLRLPYWILIAILVPAAAMIWKTRETKAENPLRDATFKPRLGVPAKLRGKFAGPAMAAFAVFSVFGFYTALIPALLGKEMHLESPAVSGSIVLVLLGVGVLVNLGTPRITPRRGLIISLSLIIPGLLLLIAAEAMKSLPVLVFATVVGGAATGLGFRASQQAVNEMAPADKRSEMVSTFLIFCYSGISLPVIGIGLLTAKLGPLVTNSLFATVVAAAAVVALVVTRRLVT
jgi:MFS family permease